MGYLQGVTMALTHCLRWTRLLVVTCPAVPVGAGKLLLAAAVLGGVELLYFAVNLTKLARGGWLTLLLAATVFTIILTWQRGSEIVTRSA